MSTRFQRPAGSYTGDLTLNNRTKYQSDSTANPKVAISSVKMDGDFNYLINSLNTLDDEMQGIVLGALPDGSIVSSKLASGAVTSSKLASASVTSAAVAADAITSGAIVSQAVTTNKIATLAVDTSRLADAAVTSDKLASTAVTNAKIASNAVTFSKIQAIATARLLGRTTAGSGDVEELSVGSGLSLAGGVLANAQTPAMTVSFTSSEQTVTAASLISVAHSLGTKPKSVMLKLICKTAEAGYAVNDEVLVCDASSNGGVSLGLCAYLDNTTHVNVRIASGGVVAGHKTTGVTTILTAANWRLVIMAFA
jgi:hypothetical protein